MIPVKKFLNNIKMNNQYSHGIAIWPSLARISATVWIFVYHYKVMLNIEHLSSMYAIIIFCFLSGWFSISIKSAPHEWIIKRYLRIMIPYWIVMAFMIMVNHYMQYKQKPIFDIFISLMGGSLFLNDPLYIISWFITLILLLYLSLYIFMIIPSIIKFPFLAFSFYMFSLIHNALIFCSAFFLGFLIKELLKNNNQRFLSNLPLSTLISDLLFKLQRYSYCFFLVHAAALHFFIKLFPGAPVKIFIFSFIMSCLSSILLFEVDKVIRKNIYSRFVFERH